MAGITTYFTVEDFAQKGVFSDSGLSTVDDVVFRKGNTFAEFEIKKVLDICNKYNNFGVNTLIVKKENELTIWIEDSAFNKSNNSYEDPNHPAPTQPQSDRSVPTKTVIKRYRGREYQETVVDWTALQQLQQTNQPKPPRKYRGQYID